MTVFKVFICAIAFVLCFQLINSMFLDKDTDAHPDDRLLINRLRKNRNVPRKPLGLRPSVREDSTIHENEIKPEIKEEVKVAEIIEEIKVSEVKKEPIVAEIIEEIKVSEVKKEPIVAEIIEEIKVSEVKEEIKVEPSIPEVKLSEIKEEVKISEVKDANIPTNAEKEIDSSEDVIRYNSKGDSIEIQKLKAPEAVGCQDNNKISSEAKNEIKKEPVVVEKATEKEIQTTDQPEHHETEASSSVEAHAIRYNSKGETREEYKDEEENEISEEVAPKKKKKKSTKKKLNSDSEEGDTININNILNDKVVNKQLQPKKPNEDDDDDDEEEEDDGIPLITIPMADIIQKYQRMSQGYISETEEYSDEIESTTNSFDDPHLKNILHEISAERKKVNAENKDGSKKGKPAAMRVIERVLSGTDEEF